MLIGLNERTVGIEDEHQRVLGCASPKRFPPSNLRSLRDINFKLVMLIGLNEGTVGTEDEHQGAP